MKNILDLKPIWIDYRNWEDYKHGMYENRVNEEKILHAKEILTSRFLKQYMTNTTRTYTTSAKVNLTNKMFNPISWLGQATCLLHGGSTAQETCRAWISMTKEEQIRANNIAKEVIKEWREQHENIQ